MYQVFATEIGIKKIKTAKTNTITEKLNRKKERRRQNKERTEKNIEEKRLGRR